MTGRVAGRVIYRAIADELSQRVLAGEWKPGEQLPAEPALVAEFKVNRLTIRQALAQLHQTGVVEIRHGSGTFVANPPPVLEIAVDLGKQVIDEGSVQATVKSITNDVTESVLAHALDPNEAAALHLRVPAEHLARLDTIVGSDGDPFAVSSYWLDDRRFGDLEAKWLPDGPLATVLREVFDVTLYYDWRAFSAVAAGPIEVEHLGGRLGAPLIVRDGVSVDSDGVPVFYVRRRIRAERASYVVHYRRGAADR
jgi:GntR family transcriptional regulator